MVVLFYTVVLLVMLTSSPIMLSILEFITISHLVQQPLKRLGTFDFSNLVSF